MDITLDKINDWLTAGGWDEAVYHNTEGWIYRDFYLYWGIKAHKIGSGTLLFTVHIPCDDGCYDDNNAPIALILPTADGFDLYLAEDIHDEYLSFGSSPDLQTKSLEKAITLIGEHACNLKNTN